jgi:uncharacterized protein (UPF0332 family)
MSVDFDDFLKSAELLFNNPDSKEIDFRNLISRSYYALFHLSREISKTLPVPTGKPSRQGSHEEVIFKFEKHTNTSIKQLGYTLRQRKKVRCKADYDIHEHIMPLEAEQHLLAVKNALKKLEQLKENP